MHLCNSTDQARKDQRRREDTRETLGLGKQEQGRQLRAKATPGARQPEDGKGKAASGEGASPEVRGPRGKGRASDVEGH